MGGYSLGRRPALDGLRGVAVLLVVWNHCDWADHESAGSVGVTIFFVLSGFLITRLLVEEHDRSGTIDLRAFMLRRARRLLPALYLFLSTVALAGTGLGAVALAGLYVADLPPVVAWAGYSHGLPDLGHMWSLSLEEQFYLVWPAVLLLLLRRVSRRAITSMLLAATGLAAGWHACLIVRGESLPRLTYSPDARFDALLAGCLVGLLIRPGNGRILRAGAVLGTVVLALACRTQGIVSLPLALEVTAAAAALLVARAATLSSGGVLACSPLRGIGRISYGLYLWHYPIALTFAPLMPPVLAFALTLPTATLIAFLSWRVLERRFVRPQHATGIGSHGPGREASLGAL
ncbi:MAG: acyltransferase family protein [Oryzihumus sp.]